ncbi:methylated-DNA--[protein]-cysteine S-methyltransferase [Lactococcus petauri]|uniref:methylated-DNA--[protein]-cysteine S-methyltransferase n=1 Tax=Lactococcus petauri TaxID=1940789 RepID=UPI003854C847
MLNENIPLSVERNAKGEITQVFFDDQHEKTTYEALNKNQNFILTTGTAFQQAVGQALARNPLPVILPCHRVTRKDGSLGGFMGQEAAVDIKQKILNYEKKLDI